MIEFFLIKLVFFTLIWFEFYLKLTYIDIVINYGGVEMVVRHNIPKKFQPIIRDDSGSRRLRLSRLARETGTQKQFLMEKIFDAGIRAVEEIINRAEEI